MEITLKAYKFQQKNQKKKKKCTEHSYFKAYGFRVYVCDLGLLSVRQLEKPRL